ncbi:MAG: class I SAM-dependent methyltransferase [Fusobacteriaceae bacterium]
MQYYNDNAERFFNETVNADMSEQIDKFLKYLNKNFNDKNINIIDLGCGSGRDSKTFIEKGYEVTPLDISPVLAREASLYIGRDVLVQDIRDIVFQQEFSGIWACASLLHISFEEMESTLKKCYTALKQNGIFYSSFKYGERDYEKEGRWFTCFTENRFREILKKNDFQEIEISVTKDVRVGRENEKWLNVILKK